MKACGLIVEYNPFHNGHLHHVQQARKEANAECIVAIMSGSFLQRGEPALVDKFHRTKAALSSGIDIVLELPYPYAVQSSDLFGLGAVKALHEIGVSSICFGSESGEINEFIQAVTTIKEHQQAYESALQTYLKQGHAFPTASSKAYQIIGLKGINLFQPNNILGLSYVRAIVEHNYQINPLTIKRIENNFHDDTISSYIASATSIRKEIMFHGLSEKVRMAMPESTIESLKEYQQYAGMWHDWEQYFPFIQHQVAIKSTRELNHIQGIDEGLEYRLKRTVSKAESFHHWLTLMKTKRYTQTRLQRMLVHLLTNTSKEEISKFVNCAELPYLRLLGLNDIGKSYLHQHKKHIQCPIYTNLNRKNEPVLYLDEKATNVYYSILPAKNKITLRQQEFRLPILHSQMH